MKLLMLLISLQAHAAKPPLVTPEYMCKTYVSHIKVLDKDITKACAKVRAKRKAHHQITDEEQEAYVACNDYDYAKCGAK